VNVYAMLDCFGMDLTTCVRNVKDFARVAKLLRFVMFVRKIQFWLMEFVFARMGTHELQSFQTSAKPVILNA
jgi:hypothetical protein